MEPARLFSHTFTSDPCLHNRKAFDRVPTQVTHEDVQDNQSTCELDACTCTCCLPVIDISTSREKHEQNCSRSFVLCGIYQIDTMQY